MPNMGYFQEALGPDQSLINQTTKFESADFNKDIPVPQSGSDPGG